MGHAAAVFLGGEAVIGGGSAAADGLVLAPETAGVSLTVTAGGLAVAGAGAFRSHNRYWKRIETVRNGENGRLQTDSRRQKSRVAIFSRAAPNGFSESSSKEISQQIQRGG